MFTSLLLTRDELLLFTTPAIVFVVVVSVVVVTICIVELLVFVLTCPFAIGCLVFASLDFSLLFASADGMFEVIGHAGSIFLTVKSSLYNTF
jgi:hypothetical protein